MVFDFDDGFPHADAVRRLREVGLSPWITYPSKSWTEDHNRYRLILLLDRYLMEVGMFETWIKEISRRLFDVRDGDHQVKDHDKRVHIDEIYYPTHRWYGGHKDPLVVTPMDDAITSLEDIYEGLALAIRRTDDNSNASRDVSRLADRLHVMEVDGGLRWNPPTSSDEVDVGTPTDVKDINVSGRTHVQTGREPSSDVEPAPMFDGRPLHMFGWRQRIAQRCRLAREFEGGVPSDVTGDETDPVPGWLTEPELVILMSNTVNLRGGQKWFKDIVAENPIYRQTGRGVEYWKPRQRSWRGYHGKPCEGCRHHDDCGRTSVFNMLSNEASFRVLSEPTTVPLQQAREELRELMQRAFRSEGRPFTLIVAETGVGKTHIYLDLLERADEDAIIAVPTHALKGSITRRARERGLDVAVQPTPPNLSDEEQQVIDAMYAVGDSAAVRQWYYQHQNIPEVKRYLDQLDEFNSSDTTRIITHAHLLQRGDEIPADRTVIVDEDLITSMVTTGNVHLSSVTKLQQHVYDHGHPAQRGAVDRLLAMIRDARDGDWITVPETVRTDLMTDLLSWEAGLNVRDNLLALLGSDEVLVTKQHRELMDVVRLHHYTMNLPPLRRTILLSATAEPWMYQRLLESREITSHTVPPVEHSGEIVQHLNRTYSREDFRRNGVPEIDDGIPVISFKGERGSFSDMVENFGGCEGLDRYRGEDLAVVGTPHVHESAYRLMNRALGFDGGEHHMAYRTVEERGLRFKFMTYWDEFMRRIQLWYIRSELLQAVGRARTIDHDCTVQLYSNYPLAGTEKRF